MQFCDTAASLRPTNQTLVVAHKLDYRSVLPFERPYRNKDWSSQSLRLELSLNRKPYGWPLREKFRARASRRPDDDPFVGALRAPYLTLSGRELPLLSEIHFCSNI